MLNTLRKGIAAALLGITVACGGSAPVGPTPAVVTVAPAPAAPVGTYTLTPSVNAVARGGQLSVSWTVSSRVETGNDWIEFSRTSDPNLFYGWADYTKGERSGTFTFTAPSQAGQYEFRYLLDDGWIDVVRSTVVTVF